MKKYLLKMAVILCLVISINKANAQNTFPSTGAAGIGTTTPDASSLLEIKSTSKGLLIPRMTKAQRDAIAVLPAVPATGLMIYQTNSTPGFYYYNGTAWAPISSTGANTTLSNLKTTAIDSSLLPAITNKINIGSSALKWKDVNLYNLKFSDGSTQTTAFTPYTAGTGISIVANAITNSAPDRTVVLSNGAGISVTGTYPNFTIATTGSGANLNLSNLSAPTAVNVALAPNSNAAYDIGSAGLSWRNLYMGGEIYMSGFHIVHSDGNNIYLGLLAGQGEVAGSGLNNTGIGNQALYSSVFGKYNTANGALSLYSNTTGNGNTANGYKALYLNNTGYSNVAVGISALYNNTGKTNIVAVGDSALYNNGIGAINSFDASWNTAVGSKSLFANTSGYANTALGYKTLDSNATGLQNTAIGTQVLFFNKNGINNTAVGAYGLTKNTSGGNNTAIGEQSLSSNTTGNNNTAAGFFALGFNTTGYSNIAIGPSALYSNTTQSNMVAVGDSALYNNGTGFLNTAVGSKALYKNTTGYDNTATGFQSLYSNTIGISNTANGNQALYSNIDGIQNTANGAGALYSNTGGSQNTAIGWEALAFNTDGYYNTANGFYALAANNTGYSNVAVGIYTLSNNTTGHNLVAVGDSALLNQSINNSGYYFNTAVGSKALFSNSTGFNNTANGYNALYFTTTGPENTANGSNALYTNSTGSSNTANGYNALYSNSTGGSNTATGSYALNNSIGVSNTADGYAALTLNVAGNSNTGVGYNADVNSSNLSNATAIGNFAIVDASNKVRIGNTDVTSIGGQVGWTTFSDGRYKQNITEDVKGLAFINSLKPITYTVDINGLIAYYNKGRKHDSSYEKMKADMQSSSDEASKIVYNGFIAQDVEAAAIKLNYNFSGVDKPKSKDGLYGLRYSDFVVPLVKAVQELSKQNDSLKKQNDIQQKQNDLQQKQIDAQQKQLNDLQASVLSIQQKQESCSPCSAALNNANATQSYAVITDGASLQQNIPNPFTNTTTIGYTIPQKITAAQIIITDKSGKTLKAITISGSGKGSLTFDASTLSSGAYQYSLVVDGRLIDTKQMVLTK